MYFGQRGWVAGQPESITVTLPGCPVPMRRIFFKTFVVAIALAGCFVFSSPAIAASDYGLGATAKAAGLKTGKSIPEIAGQIIGAGLSLLGIVFLGLMLYGGFNWMIARGDTKRVEAAKDTITNAVIGFAIVASAYAITDFAVGAITQGTASGGGGGGEGAGDALAACQNSCDRQFPPGEGNANEAIDCYDECNQLNQ